MGLEHQVREHTFQFGEVEVTVRAPEGFWLSLDLRCHPGSDEDTFERALRAFGGLAAFEAVCPSVRWLITPAQQDDAAGMSAEATLFAPRSIGEPPVYSGMQKLAERQQREQQQREAVAP